MSDPIELTELERRSAYSEIAPLLTKVALNRMLPDYAISDVVDSILFAVNRVRAGDPVGTIRKGPDGRVAVRVQALRDNGDIGPNSWVHISTVTGTMARPHFDNPNAYDDWDVVFSPEAS